MISRTIIIVALGLATTAICTRSQTPQQGAAIFEKSCYSCHNIGGGNKVGPDLKGATERRTTEWLHEFIPGPAAANRRGDPTAVDLFKRFSPNVMPDQPLSADQIDAVLALIGDLTQKNQQFLPAGARLSRPVRPSDAGAGRDLFFGRIALKNGAPACISCHSLEEIGMFGGGTLAPDLTGVNIKYNDPQLIAILQNPNFPTMSTVFGKHPIDNEEIVKLFALFQQSSARLAHAPIAPSQPLVRIEARFILLGGGAMAFALVGMNFIWRKRLKGVRRTIVQRGRRS
jgi:mono/diheme cytochrome c family protein